MAYRIVTVLVLLLTVGFFILYQKQSESSLPADIKTIAAAPQDQSFFVQNEVLLLMDEGKEKLLDSVLAQYNLVLVTPLGEWIHARIKNSGPEQNIVSINSQAAQQNIALVLALEAHPAVHSAHLNYVQPVDSFASSCAPTDDQATTASDDAMPHDPLFGHQWHLSKRFGMDLPGAWAITKGNAKNVIALVDRNFVFTAEDLLVEHCKSRQFYYENILDYFPNRKNVTSKDNSIHGTNVMSVVTPCTDNAVGLAGIDWYAQAFAVDSRTDSSLSARMFGLMWAAGIDACSSSIAPCSKETQVQKNLHPANVLNASFGFMPSQKIGPLYGPVLDIIGKINRKGSILVASAGNESSMSDRRLPGSAGGVISVGASNIKKQSAHFSNFGRSIDVLAPGENIIGLGATDPVRLNGTSFSSPLVAGIASLMLAINPNLSWKHVEYILKKTAHPLSCTDYCPDTMSKKSRRQCQNYCCKGEKTFCARGIANAQKAVEQAKLGIPPIPLVDVDDYFIPLSEHTNFRGSVLVKNWGTKPGLVRMKPTDPFLKIHPSTLTIAAADLSGMPATSKITLYYDHIPTAQTVISLILEISPLESPNDFHDQIEAIVEIVPDIQTDQKRYLELLPKS